jgi:hypothetical protein
MKGTQEMVRNCMKQQFSQWSNKFVATERWKEERNFILLWLSFYFMEWGTENSSSKKA